MSHTDSPAGLGQGTGAATQRLARSTFGVVWRPEPCVFTTFTELGSPVIVGGYVWRSTFAVVGER